MNQAAYATAKHSRTILIADEDPSTVTALALRCRALGLNVFVAYDAFTALQLARTHKPDFVCLDGGMPGGNGLTACEMLATDECCSSIPVMALTDRSNPDTMQYSHGIADYYIEKCPNVWSRVGPLLTELIGASNRAALALHEAEAK